MKVLVDQSYLKALGGDDVSAVSSIVEDFKADAKGLVLEYKKLVEQGNEDGARRVIHQLKGSSGSLGLSALHQSCVVAENSDNQSGAIAELESLIEESVVQALKVLAN